MGPPYPAPGRARISCERASELGSSRTDGVDALWRRRKPRWPEKPTRAVRAYDTAVREAGADGG